MLINKALLHKLPLDEQQEIIISLQKALQGGYSFTRYGKRSGVVASTYDTLQEAKGDIRTWSVYPRTTTETIKYNRILRSLGIK